MTDTLKELEQDITHLLTAATNGAEANGAEANGDPGAPPATGTPASKASTPTASPWSSATPSPRPAWSESRTASGSASNPTGIVSRARVFFVS